VDVNPRLDPEENTGLGNPPCFCPFIMNLSPLAQTLPFVHMCIEPRKNSDAIEFPNTRVAIPVVHERLFTHLDPVYEGASLVVKHVGLVRQFVEPVTASAAIRTLVLREVLVLDDISIERMPHLRVLDIAPVAAPAPRPATVAVHFETLPALRDFALDMARGVLTKEYGLPPFRMGNARAPTPHWAPLRLSMLRITGTERAQLKVFELAVNGEDLDDLVRTPHDESAAESASDPYHPLLRFKRVKRFQLYVQLREHGDALYRRRSGDYNLSPYNPFPVHQAVMRRAHEAFESFAAGDLESMRYKASSVLPLMAADRFLAAVQGMDVRIFSMNAQAAVALRWAKFNGVFVSSVDPQTGRSVAVADDAAEARPPNVDVPVVVIEVTPMIRRDSLLARAGDRCLYQSISRKQRSEMRKAGPRKEKRYVVQCATPRWPVLSLGVEDCLPPMVDAATMVYPWQTEEYEPWYYFAVSQDACVLMLPGCVENVKDKQRYVMSKQLQRTEKLYPPAMLRLTHTHTDLCSVAMLPLRGLIGGR
ncbi:MAG TPA: hypothetical protein VKD22_14255, partial [Ramlibacter sp.]|nr:hypothetical protein [Ramlibacter sp.]